MFMAFSDFPPKDPIKYWSKLEYLQYLEEYVDHFGLREFIRLGTAVTNATLKNGQWQISTRSWSSTQGEGREGSKIYGEGGEDDGADGGPDDAGGAGGAGGAVTTADACCKYFLIM